MKYLLMPIAAPMQSWGDTVVSGDDRTTLPFPTHSGIAGMICAALGIDRKDETRIREVHNGLGIIVAEVRTGIMQQDFFTVNNVIRATGGTDGSIIGKKFFLSDYLFLAAVSTSDNAPVTLSDIGQALLFPLYALYAGRRAYPLSRLPVWHKNGVIQILEWQDPIQEIRELMCDDDTRTEIFMGASLASKINTELKFYMDASEKSGLGYAGEPSPIPYTVRDRYYGRYRNWGYREFEERDIEILSLKMEE